MALRIFSEVEIYITYIEKNVWLKMDESEDSNINQNFNNFNYNLVDLIRKFRFIHFQLKLIQLTNHFFQYIHSHQDLKNF